VTVFAGTYFINLIDSSGCSISTTVTVGQPDPIEVFLGEGPTINLGEPSAVVSGTVIIPSGNAFNVSWSPDNVECLNADCTTVSVSPTETTLYTLEVTDTNGCTGSAQTTVNVRKSRNVYFANIFSPDQDGVNDFFQPVLGIGADRVTQFVIYDRWGNMVFERSDYVPDPAGPGGWDGTFNGRKLDPAVFVYYCKVRFLDNREIEYTGSVTMLGSAR
jgi:gliding motility-associated-like protein